ncbi:MAG: Flp family type IVb pilin [Methyloceanibacter sp.]
MSNMKHVTEPVGLTTRLAATARRFAADSSGATAVEYGIMTLIAIAIMALVSQIGGSVSGMFEMLKNAFG